MAHAKSGLDDNFKQTDACTIDVSLREQRNAISFTSRHCVLQHPTLVPSSLSVIVQAVVTSPHAT